MKKLVLLLAVIATNVFFTGCTKTDDALDETDPIIGKWTLMTQYENEKPVVISECSKNNSLEFTAEGVFKIINFESVASNCLDFSQNGTWQREFTNKYKLSNSETPLYTKFAYTDTANPQLIVEQLFGTGTEAKMIKRVYTKK
jgi:hypothetical protein